MDKKEEIREEIAGIIINQLIHEMWTEPAPQEYQNKEDDYVVHHVGFATESLNKTITGLLSYLHSQGVVLKVDRELPNINICEVNSFPLGMKHDTYCHVREQQKMLKAGYVAVESLIEG